MCARFTVLSDTPIAAAIAGCVIPLSRNSTIWMRWRGAAGIFHRSAVFSRRTSALLHLTICFPPNQMAQANHSLGTKNNSPSSLCRLKSSIQAVIEVVLDKPSGVWTKIGIAIAGLVLGWLCYSIASNLLTYLHTAPEVRH